MQTGTKISGAAHLVVLGLAVFSSYIDDPEPLDFEVQDVSIITAEQFAAMTASMQAPKAGEAIAPPSRPEVEPDTATPEIRTEPDEPPQQATPEPTPQPALDAEPETLPDQPAPDVEATVVIPQPDPPQPEPTRPAEVVEPVAVSPRPQVRPDRLPEISTEPEPAERVTPEPVAAPPPDTTPDEVETPAVTVDAGAEEPQEPAEATAPEEAADQIVTEAEKPASLAPTRSPRPPTRPTRREVAAVTPTPTPAASSQSEPANPDDPQEATPSAQTGVEDALASALGDNSSADPSASPSAPVGPPLTGGEKETLRLAVSSCWNTGSLSTAALRTTVVVGLSMTRDGKPAKGSVHLLSSSGGEGAAANQAYEAARRAIIRCGAKGYKLPAEKYSQWREIEMTFNPERMRIK